MLPSWKGNISNSFFNSSPTIEYLCRIVRINDRNRKKTKYRYHSTYLPTFQADDEQDPARSDPHCIFPAAVITFIILLCTSCYFYSKLVEATFPKTAGSS